MSADFWAGYISGAAGIIIGNPLDLIKVRLQAIPAPTTPLTSAPLPTYTTQFSTASSLIRGATAPILGYGALNALVFVTYNRTALLLNPSTPAIPPTLWTTWIAGAVGGLATWVVSTPTELIKCRAQISNPSASPPAPTSWSITRDILKTEGIRGLYFGGVVTALRDSIGYGFYFWSYELSTRLLASTSDPDGQKSSSSGQEAAKVLFCGGLAGVVTWASIFPLDVIKTRVQTQLVNGTAASEATPLVGADSTGNGTRLGAVDVARRAYATEGLGVFFRGLMICSVRAFLVNAVQWAAYEWIMRELQQSSKRIHRSENVLNT